MEEVRPGRRSRYAPGPPIAGDPTAPSSTPGPTESAFGNPFSRMIRCKSVTKLYGDKPACRDVSFEVPPGEIVGFLGPNGAGKSTLLKMMSTYLPVTSGEIEIAGHDTKKDPLAVRRSLGYLPEHNALYETMRVDRLLSFVGRARGLSGKRLAERTEWVVDRCTLGDVLAKRVQQCSKGYRQRIGVAAALIHDPPVLLLDEPTHGLDPLQVVAFRDFLREIREGRAILFSSHILSEVVEISDRLLVIQQGELILDQRVEALRAAASKAQRTIEEHILDEVKTAGARA